MHQAKIGIVEDEFIIANDIRQLLEELNYAVPKPCKNYAAAVLMLEKESPDLVILDIQIEGDKDGVELAEYIRRNIDIPFIFLTANSDACTVERVKKVQPNAYLSKPFNKNDLYLSIEIALSNFNIQRTGNKEKTDENYLVKDSLFIKDGQYFHKVKLDDVLFIASEGAYITFHTETKKFLVRGSIPQYLEKINAKNFFRVHRSYAVNLDKLELINSSFLKIKDIEIPISKNFRDELLTLINIG